jgi:hypothetical protein
VTPEEIAVSILAELIAVRRGKIDDPHVAAVSKRWGKAAQSTVHSRQSTADSSQSTVDSPRSTVDVSRSRLDNP